MGRPELPSAVIEASRALGLRQDALGLLPGAAGQTWSTGEHILRVRPANALRAERAAWAAAASVVPTPELIDLVELETLSAALLKRLPGTAAGNLDALTPERARKRGEACGRLHGLLSRVAAPAVVPATPRPTTWPTATPSPQGDRLLHLDLHPFNVLLDDSDAVSGVIDWANAAAGHPDLDRARSASILTLDPRATARGADPRWAALTAGWTEAGHLHEIPPMSLAWAYRFMLDDLSSRYDQEQLARIHQALSAIDQPTPMTAPDWSVW